MKEWPSPYKVNGAGSRPSGISCGRAFCKVGDTCGIRNQPLLPGCCPSVQSRAPCMTHCKGTEAAARLPPPSGLHPVSSKRDLKEMVLKVIRVASLPRRHWVAQVLGPQKRGKHFDWIGIADSRATKIYYHYYYHYYYYSYSYSYSYDYYYHYYYYY